jgi:hypothetical protein
MLINVQHTFTVSEWCITQLCWYATSHVLSSTIPFYRFLYLYFVFIFIFLLHFSFFKKLMVAIFRASFWNVLHQNDTLRSTTVTVPLDFFLWGYLKRSIYLIHGMILNSSQTLSEIVRGKGASKCDRMICACLMSHIYKNPVETGKRLIARILSVNKVKQKCPRYVCDRTQQTLCITSWITLKSQAASSTALVNYSKILPLKCTTIETREIYLQRYEKI